MNKEAYADLMNNIRSKPLLAQFIRGANKATTYVVYVIFSVFMASLLIKKDADFFRILLTTAVSFFIVSVFRKIFNRERPYEKFGEKSVIEKDKKGNSFPSRHVFSTFVIAMACLYVNLTLGIIMFVISISIAILRVVGGVHYISDVIAGALIGIISGVIGLYLI
ncbi:MAG: phosphatase PAP2 family protein [Lachnospiraceae bacterium]|nr:phosphatase PAP2 family protein [Lachnospiraceae bacterium]